jgi:hypothetical protein
LKAGRPRQALVEADSAIVSMRRGHFCAPSRGYYNHALAALALGDTATAARDFIIGSAGYPLSDDRMLDTARVHLGARFTEAAMLAGADSARRAARLCEDERLARRQAQRRRLAGAEARGQ